MDQWDLYCRFGLVPVSRSTSSCIQSAFQKVSTLACLSSAAGGFKDISSRLGGCHFTSFLAPAQHDYGGVKAAVVTGLEERLSVCGARLQTIQADGNPICCCCLDARRLIAGILIMGLSPY